MEILPVLLQPLLKPLLQPPLQLNRLLHLPVLQRVVNIPNLALLKQRGFIVIHLAVRANNQLSGPQYHH